VDLALEPLLLLLQAVALPADFAQPPAAFVDVVVLSVERGGKSERR
jgi:hypothetical protein